MRLKDGVLTFLFEVLIRRHYSIMLGIGCEPSNHSVSSLIISFLYCLICYDRSSSACAYFIGNCGNGRSDISLVKASTYVGVFVGRRDYRTARIGLDF